MSCSFKCVKSLTVKRKLNFVKYLYQAIRPNEEDFCANFKEIVFSLTCVFFISLFGLRRGSTLINQTF